jgi:hypothetical protein
MARLKSMSKSRALWGLGRKAATNDTNPITSTTEGIKVGKPILGTVNRTSKKDRRMREIPRTERLILLLAKDALP